MNGHDIALIRAAQAELDAIDDTILAAIDAATATLHGLVTIRIETDGAPSAIASIEPSGRRRIMWGKSGREWLIHVTDAEGQWHPLRLTARDVRASVVAEGLLQALFDSIHSHLRRNIEERRTALEQIAALNTMLGATT